ncbi:MAG: zinc ribbon domain-containing protein [Planctomycetota bacterium]|nr:MAG: zinc ribbon domain-containing protein [Planctomycetota bacterium]
MPHYDYRCDACEHQFEAFQSIKAAPLRDCPRCGRSRLRRLISPGAGLLFRGSGFHATDYRAGAPPADSGADGCTPGGCARPECPKT